MKGELISFETAKLAKVKRFNIETLHWYSKSGVLNEPYEENGSSTDVEFKVELSDLFDYHNSEFSNGYSAPTQSLLQKWLREEHSVHIEILAFHMPNGKDMYRPDFFTPIGSPEVEYNDESMYSTYEKSLEAGLSEGLKFIK